MRFTDLIFVSIILSIIAITGTDGQAKKKDVSN